MLESELTEEQIALNKKLDAVIGTDWDLLINPESRIIYIKEFPYLKISIYFILFFIDFYLRRKIDFVAVLLVLIVGFYLKSTIIKTRMMFKLAILERVRPAMLERTSKAA